MFGIQHFATAGGKEIRDAYETVLREVVKSILRWMGTAEAHVRWKQ